MTSRERDGLLMLLVSITLIALTFGLTFIFVFVYIFLIAMKTDCDEITTDHIVVLGKKLLNNRPDKDYRLRLDRVIRIVANRINVQIYVLGGVTGVSRISESDAGKCYLEDNGVQSGNIYVEEKSRDTLDNMKQLESSAMLKDKHIAIITNRYHLARASVMARGFGFDVERCAAEDTFTPGVAEFVTLLVETYFLHWYLSGWSYAKLTRNQRMLSRIQ